MHYIQIRMIVFLLGITSIGHAQCFTCGWPTHIDSDAVDQIIRVLDLSTPQQHHITQTHERHREDWMSAQDELVAPLATVEQQRGAASMQEGLSIVTSVIRRARLVRSQLQDLDARFFDDVAIALSANQHVVLETLRHQRNSMWHERSVNGMIETPDPAKLIAAKTPPSEHRVILESIEQVLQTRITRLQQIESKTLDCIVRFMKAAGNGTVDMPAFQSSFAACTDTEREAREKLVAWQNDQVLNAVNGLDLTNATRRSLAQLFGADPAEDDPLLAHFVDMIDRLDVLPAQHAAANAILHEHFAQLRNINAITDVDRRHEALTANSNALNQQLTALLGRENMLAIFTPEQRSTEEEMLAMLLKETTPIIPTSSGCGVLTSSQFEMLRAILALPESHHAEAIDIRNITREAFLDDPDIKAAVGLNGRRSAGNDGPTTVSEWINTRMRGIESAAEHDTNMVDLLAQLARHAPHNLRTQLAHAWIREIRKAAVTQAPNALGWVPSDDHTHLIAIATNATLDLNDPALALALLEQTTAVSNALNTAIEAALTHSATKTGTPGFEVAAKRHVTHLNTLVIARRDAAALFGNTLPAAQRVRWNAQLIRSRWPAITGPLHKAQERLRTLTSNLRVPRGTKAALLDEFANVVAAATPLEDQAISILLAKPTHQHTRSDVSPAARIRLEAIRAELNTLLSVWSTYERNAIKLAARAMARPQ